MPDSQRDSLIAILGRHQERLWSVAGFCAWVAVFFYLVSLGGD